MLGSAWYFERTLHSRRLVPDHLSSIGQRSRGRQGSSHRLLQKKAVGVAASRETSGQELRVWWEPNARVISCRRRSLYLPPFDLAVAQGANT